MMKKEAVEGRGAPPEQGSGGERRGMQDIFGSVRRSFVLRHGSPAGDGGLGVSGAGFGDRVASCVRKSWIGSGMFSKLQSPSRLLSPPPPPSAIGGGEEHHAPAIRWRKGELIGCGAFGHVYMGMNLDSGELLAVKQVLIGTSNASKEKAQAHIRELEEEVKLLRNLSHPNIVRYLGTAREEGTLNILLEFVPGGSISSLLAKFESFPEAVIRTYTKQLLQGLEYLHRNGIIHRDIKGANILVDNKGCIKLADFGASKQVAKLATITAAKSMKGTPYWMAPEVIVQSGHSFSADIWSVGCTVIEMATGKPPWSQQYQEVAAMFHVGTTKSHPPIPEHLSTEAIDFLLKCLQQEPDLRPKACVLLEHPFVTGKFQAPRSMNHSSNTEHSSAFSASKFQQKILSPAVDFGTGEWSDMCAGNFTSSNPLQETRTCLDSQMNCQSFNPMCEPLDDWPCKFDASPVENSNVDYKSVAAASSVDRAEYDDNDDNEVMETKIRDFLDEKALDLKKLQTPLYEEFYNTMHAANSPVAASTACERPSFFKLLPRSSSKASPPNAVASRLASPFAGGRLDLSPGNDCSGGKRISSGSCISSRILREVPSPQHNERVELQRDDKRESTMASSQSFSEMKKKWKEELDQELESQREKMRQAAGAPSRSSSPNDRGSNNRRRSQFRLFSPGK